MPDEPRFNFRRFLPERRAEPPAKLTQLAEAEKGDPTPSRPFRQLSAIRETAPLPPAAIDKTANAERPFRVVKRTPKWFDQPTNIIDRQF